MKAEIENIGTVGDLLRVELWEGEEFFAEPGALVSMDEGIEVKSLFGYKKEKPKWFKPLFRLAPSKDAPYANWFVARKDGVVELAPEAPSTLFKLDLRGEKWMFADGAYFAHAPGVEVSFALKGGFKSMLAGTGTVGYASGNGPLYLCAGWGLKERELRAGEVFYVDNNCFVAAPFSMKMEPVLLGKDIATKFMSGEAFILRFEGPGKVFYSSASVKSFADALWRYISKRIGSSRSRGGSGLRISFGGRK